MDFKLPWPEDSKLESSCDGECTLAHSTLTFFNAEHQTGKLWNMDAIFKFLPSMTLDNG